MPRLQLETWQIAVFTDSLALFNQAKIAPRAPNADPSAVFVAPASGSALERLTEANESLLMRVS